MFTTRDNTQVRKKRAVFWKFLVGYFNQMKCKANNKDCPIWVREKF